MMDYIRVLDLSIAYLIITVCLWFFTQLFMLLAAFSNPGIIPRTPQLEPESRPSLL